MYDRGRKVAEMFHKERTVYRNVNRVYSPLHSLATFLYKISSLNNDRGLGGHTGKSGDDGGATEGATRGAQLCTAIGTAGSVRTLVECNLGWIGGAYAAQLFAEHRVLEKVGKLLRTKSINHLLHCSLLNDRRICLEELQSIRYQRKRTLAHIITLRSVCTERPNVQVIFANS